ncbi:MAG: HAD-IC family P-type ATPase [Eubacteriales bacterium]|nr:HAD-IC family P-type ATPase [Eubacteriales bacterium]
MDTKKYNEGSQQDLQEQEVVEGEVLEPEGQERPDGSEVPEADETIEEPVMADAEEPPAAEPEPEPETEPEKQKESRFHLVPLKRKRKTTAPEETGQEAAALEAVPAVRPPVLSPDGDAQPEAGEIAVAGQGEGRPETEIPGQEAEPGYESEAAKPAAEGGEPDAGADAESAEEEPEEPDPDEIADPDILGLTQAQVDKRVRLGKVNDTGENIFKTKKEIIKDHTLTYFNFLNLALGCLILISGQIKNITFMGVIIINSLIGIAQEMKVKNLVDKLSVITASKARVIRDEKEQEIPIQEVVVDDVMRLSTGDQVCADSVVLESNGLEVNESMLTGESKPVRKKAGDRLMSGSFLTAGTGTVQVVHVGEDNYAYQLMKKAKTKKRATSEMQRTIKRIIKIVGVVIIPIGILLYRSQRIASGANFSDALVSTVAGIIGMIPEGLVLLTSISFILGVGRLAKKRALVQEMEAIEALARVNVLCLDKTGTITTGKLEVVKVLGVNGTEESRIEQIMNHMAFAFDDVNSTQEALMEYFVRRENWKPTERIPFSSDRKYRAIRYAGQGCFVLGAPDFLIEEDFELKEQVEHFSEEGLRVLLLGTCEDISSEDGKVTGVQPIGLIVISDCIRPEAMDTFRYFKEQNVDIKVISGDNPVTVSQIAVKAGLEGGERYVDAQTLPTDPKELAEVVDQYSVFGRVKPEQKQQLVRAYQANKKVVGMVGDGVNDVLALKDADCGIAMAAGSDAAKQVAHIVLLDSNFACLKNIVSEGRMIITNIERVSSLYLTKTIYSMILCIIFIFLEREYPFIPIQLSWMSTVAIGIPSFILTLERVEAVNSSGFLRYVMRYAVPSALTMVICMLFIQLFRPFWGSDDTMTSTMNLLVGTAVSMILLWRVCQPMNLLRRTLCISVAVIFMTGVLLVPGLLGIYPIFRWEVAFVIPMICMASQLTRLFSWMIKKAYQFKNWLICSLKSLREKMNIG